MPRLMSAACLALTVHLVSPAIAAVDIAIPEFPLNEWVELRTPGEPLPATGQPKALVSTTGETTYPYVTIRRVRLEKGERYTLETSYPADHQDGSLCLRGHNPLAHSATVNSPSGTTYLPVCSHRGFPGGEIEGREFGRRETVTVSPRSEHEWGFLTYYSNAPDVPMKVRLLHPAVSDETLKKAYSWTRLPDGREWVNGGGKSRQTQWWLGYAYREPKLPFTFEVTPIPGSIAGIWYGKWGTFTLAQTGEAVAGDYDSDHGKVEGTLRAGVFEGWWSETHSNTACAEKRGDRKYWGRFKATLEGKRFSGVWGYCDDEPGKPGFYADLREPRPASGQPGAVSETGAADTGSVSGAEGLNGTDTADHISRFEVVGQDTLICPEFENERLCRRECDPKSACAVASGGCGDLCALLFDEDRQPVSLPASPAVSPSAGSSLGEFTPFAE
ncbi:MAG: hypothetical protein KDI42_04095 [Gammaproteobacteria bacterium]|nr:hypothetical protein [Gammaproteobacteria bacterium]